MGDPKCPALARLSQRSGPLSAPVLPGTSSSGIFFPLDKQALLQCHLIASSTASSAVAEGTTQRPRLQRTRASEPTARRVHCICGRPRERGRRAKGAARTWLAGWLAGLGWAGGSALQSSIIITL